MWSGQFLHGVDRSLVFIMEHSGGSVCDILSVRQGYSESPDLEFEYADTDKWAAELAGKGQQTFVLFDRSFDWVPKKIKTGCFPTYSYS